MFHDKIVSVKFEVLMKKLFVFDLDNTLRSTNLRKILPNTKKLIQEIAVNPDYILALATGRGLAKLDVLEDMDAFFKYKILVNGAITLEDNHILNENHIKKEVVKDIMDAANQRKIALGLVGMHDEVVTFIDKEVEKAFDNFNDKKPKAQPTFYLEQHVYQMWVFHKDEKMLEKEIRQHQDLEIYHWHDGGFDIVPKGISKASALKELMKKYPDYQVIAVGDGHNDLDMIRLADVGIIMENSRWIKDAQGSFQYIAPHVDHDALYDFLKTQHIL